MKFSCARAAAVSLALLGAVLLGAGETRAQIGQLDVGFNAGAGFQFIQPSSPGGLVSCYSLARDATGAIVTYSVESVGGQTRHRLRRLTGNGSVDTNFGTGGLVELPTDLSSTLARSQRVRIDSKQRILVFSARGGDFTGYSAWIARFTSTGAPDTTFGTNGVVQFSISGATSVTEIRGLIVLADDSIFAAGAEEHFEGSALVWQLLLVRLTEQGGAFSGFGNAGIKLFKVSDISGLAPGAFAIGGLDILALRSGKFLIPGFAYRTYPGTQNGRQDFILFRVDSTGALDGAFGSGGVREDIDPQGQIWTFVKQVEEQSDGKLIVRGRLAVMGSGYGLARFLPSGELDPTFATNGIYTSTANGVGSSETSIALQPNDQILFANRERVGTNVFKPAIRRLTRDGQPEVNFGDAGVSTISPISDTLLLYSEASVVWDPAGFAIGVFPVNIPSAPANYRDQSLVFRLIADTAPGVTIVGPSSGNLGQPLSFVANASVAPGASVASVTWDLDGDGQFDDAAGSTANVTFTTAGAKSIAVRVSDDNQLASSSTASVVISGGRTNVRIKGKSAKLSPEGQITLSVVCTETEVKCVGTLVLLSGTTTFAKAKYSIKPGKTASTVLRLSRSGQVAVRTQRPGVTAQLQIKAGGQTAFLGDIRLRK